MPAQPKPGAVVAWWDGGGLAFGVVAGEEKRRIRLVLLQGREARVQPSRIVCEVETPGDVPGQDVDQRKAAGARVERVTRQLRAEAGRVEVPLVWEIVAESRGGELATPAELAELALESRGGAAQAAVILALLEDGVHFARKGDGWLPRAREAVGELERERDRVQQRARERAAFFDAVQAAVRGHEPFRESGSEIERRFLEALRELAVREEAAVDAARAPALEALEASGLRFDRPHEGAFRLLRRLGRFDSDDQNLQVLRYGLCAEFGPEVLARAEARAGRGFVRQGRRDLTELEALTIDGPHTREIDDALSVAERSDGGLRVGIHIADPAAFVEPEDVIDREASVRALTFYMPDLRVPMVPAAISEDAASLIEGAERPALSFLVDLDADGEIRDWELVRSIVRSRARLDYDRADAVVANGGGPLATALRSLAVFAELREQARIRAGAVLFHAPEVEIHVGADGEPVLERLASASCTRRAVTEAMVLAGALGAIFCLRFDVPVIFRRQGAPQTPDDARAVSADDPVAIRRLRLSLKRAEVSLEPGLHHSLALEAYTQVTSPIRRYQDLAIHRQIIACLADRPPCYDVDAMRRILATTEQADADARRAERAAFDYWMLRYLAARTGTEVEGCVVQVEPKPVVQLLETLREQPMPGLAGGVELGQAIRLRIERVVPRAGLLGLRRVD